MNSSRILKLKQCATFLAKGVSLELYLTPKPGLVDLRDCGSHHDLSLATMEHSIRIVTRYLDQLCVSLTCGEGFTSQTVIGKQAEQTLFNVLGTNTHKGYIFLSGLLLVAFWQAASPDEQCLRKNIAAVAGQFFTEQGEHETHGKQQRTRHGGGGIVREALNGFPALFDEAVPTYRTTIKHHKCHKTASFAMMGRLMQIVDDTTALHRYGAMGLSRLQKDGRQIERLIASGEDCEPFLHDLNRQYIQMNLTMGGVADMLGLSYSYLLACGHPLS